MLWKRGGSLCMGHRAHARTNNRLPSSDININYNLTLLKSLSYWLPIATSYSNSYNCRFFCMLRATILPMALMTHGLQKNRHHARPMIDLECGIAGWSTIPCGVACGDFFIIYFITSYNCRVFCMLWATVLRVGLMTHGLQKTRHHACYMHAWSWLWHWLIKNNNFAHKRVPATRKMPLYCNFP